MASSSPSPVPDDVDLVQLLVQNRLCGEVATPVGSCVTNCRRLVAGDKDCTFGLSDWRQATFDDAVAALEALGGGRLRNEPDDRPGFIDPSGTLVGVRKHRDVVAELVGGGGGNVLVVTGHPVLVPHYAAVAHALARAGCHLLEPFGAGGQPVPAAGGGPWSIAYVDGAGALLHDGSVHHTHRPDYMEAMLERLGRTRPDLVVADHGFAGAAIEAGIATLSIADVNDPALPLAQALGRTDGVLLIDDALRPELFAPVTDAILAWA